MAKSFYLTTTLPYVNADPHLGFALELVQADVLVRARALVGDNVFFNTGTDEHGLKIYRQALAAGLEPQVYADQAAAKFQALLRELNIWPEINFIRTTDLDHVAAAQEFWRRCAAVGDIYKKNYQTKYCVGCELEKTESELENGKCPVHPNLDLELIEEENYFFRFSKYQPALLDWYAQNPESVLPATRLNEIRAFVERGLEDFSISRLAKKMPWGVPVPGDESQVMYVWFDALVNYISALGWPKDEDNFRHWWPGEQIAGKDNLRQQAAMWPAMLMSAGLLPPRRVFIHGFITSGGQKMSKSLGNVIDPRQLVAEYGTDAVRYYLLRHVHPNEDSDVTVEKFKEAYNANLANGLGNLVSRVMKMATTFLDGPVELTPETRSDFGVQGDLERFEFNSAMNLIWERIGHDDALIAIEKPFVGAKSDDTGAREKALLIIKKLVRELNAIADDLTPFLPTTAQTIKQLVKENKMPAKPLFGRK